MDRDELEDLLLACALDIAQALEKLSDFGPAGTRPGQYRSDLVADEVGVARLLAGGLSVLSEESGRHEASHDLLAVLDPVDGSTNASRGLPWFATSICVLDAQGPLAALVRNQATGTCYRAWRGSGATRDGAAIRPRPTKALSDAILALSGYPRRYLGWRQYRVYGAAALDLCAVADGTFDAYLDCGYHSHAPWDYLGGLLVCEEAGGIVKERSGQELVVTGDTDRRSPVAAGTEALVDQIIGALMDPAPDPRR